MTQPLLKRRHLLERHILPKLEEPIRYSPILEGRLNDLVRSVKAQRLEGLIAKRCDSKYEPGLRSGAWLKMRVNAGQEFVIGGYTPSLKNFDALVIGYYDGPKLMYAARTAMGLHRLRALSCSKSSSRSKSTNVRSLICPKRRPVAGAPV
jgi:ATP-dependent DNA ligase